MIQSKDKIFNYETVKQGVGKSLLGLTVKAEDIKWYIHFYQSQMAKKLLGIHKVPEYNGILNS